MILLSKMGSREILYVNNAICNELGYTQAEMLKLNIFDIDSTYKNIRDSVIKELTEKGNVKFESELIRKDGSTYAVDVSVSMITYEQDQLIFANIETKK
jgi:PAS domain S-box-containing protein